MTLKRQLIAFLAIAITTSLLAACSPAPRRDLTAAERVADLQWLISKIEANYAPLEYKQELHGFDYELKKTEYLKSAQVDQSNEEFYLLLKKFIAEFKDGHMSLIISPALLPERSEVAYLGVKGHRHGDKYKVKELLPTFAEGSAYLIEKGDNILKFNGKTLKEAVDELLVQYRDVGNQEANYTILMSSLFMRDSINFPMPVEDEAKLLIERDGKEIEVTVPWIREDRLKFQQAQQKALMDKAEAVDPDLNIENELGKASALVQVAGTHPFVTDSYVRNVIQQRGEDGIDLVKAIEGLKSLSTDSTFEFRSDLSLSTELELFETVTQEIVSEEKTPFEKLKEERHVLAGARPVPGSSTFPAYVALKSQDGKRHSIGYIRIETFSPLASTDEAVEELNNTLKYMRDFGVEGTRNIIVDLIDNGGGSLSLGLQLAAQFSREEIKVPGLMYSLNDAWLDTFERNMLLGSNDAAREVSEAAFKGMIAGFNAGDKLSENLSSHVLYPFQITANEDLVIEDETFKFNMVLLVNEMCASMCDIFTSTLKENDMAVVMGSKTMGAGGNVVQHLSAPNSGAVVSLTESLVVSPQGNLLENNGVEPDIAIDMSEKRIENFYEVIENAATELLKEKDGSTESL